MAPEFRNALRVAYLKTTYRVCANGLECDVVVGRVCVALDRWLSDNGMTCWAFISACNPGSRLLSSRINRVRHKALIARLVGQGRVWFPALNVASGSSWPSEPSVFVPNMTVDNARWIAVSFGQNALVYGRRSMPARLLWCSGD